MWFLFEATGDIEYTKNMDFSLWNTIPKTNLNQWIVAFFYIFLIPAIPLIILEITIRIIVKIFKLIGGVFNLIFGRKGTSQEESIKAFDGKGTTFKSSQDNSNNDLNYWYELKVKGAISDVEYEAKKNELLK